MKLKPLPVVCRRIKYTSRYHLIFARVQQFELESDILKPLLKRWNICSCSKSWRLSIYVQQLVIVGLGSVEHGVKRPAVKVEFSCFPFWVQFIWVLHHGPGSWIKEARGEQVTNGFLHRTRKQIKQGWQINFMLLLHRYQPEWKILGPFPSCWQDAVCQCWTPSAVPL